MAITDDIILKRGECLLTIAASTLGFYFYQGRALNFGTVAAACEVSDFIAVGESVWFDASAAKTIAYGSTIYYLVLESNIHFKEVTPP
jgi:hypothetical protein